MFSSVLALSNATRLLLVPVALTLAVGCTTQATSEADEAASTVQGIVRVERTATDDGATTSVSAKFMRILPSDRVAAEQLVGTRVELPTVGDCAPLSSLQKNVAPSKLKGTVELVDVGDLTLITHAPVDSTTDRPGAEQVVTLAPRAFPDVGDIASGVFYTSPDAARDLTTPAKLGFRGTGASIVEPFAIDVDAPAAPTNVRVSGHRFVSQSADAAGTESPKVEVGRDISLEWDASSADATELVYVDIHGSTPFRCAFHDLGTASVPGDVLSQSDVGTMATLSLHRLREQDIRLELDPTKTERQETTSVRFDLARSGRIAITPSR